jgi:hypothetical protein
MRITLKQHSKMIKTLLDKIKRYWALIVSGLGIIGQLSLLFGYLSVFSKWSDKWLFKYIRDNYINIWLISLTLVIIALASWIIIINRRFIYGFSDSFKKLLNHNWDFIGPWRITDENILVVASSDEGGITKKGADWENYTVTFKAKIITNCIGVIIRARDLKNYYMIQIGKNDIVPHRRISYPRIKKPMTNESVTEIDIQTGWQIFKDLSIKLNSELNDWFVGCIKVKGQTLSFYINDELVLHLDSFLEISKGKIGFRCWGLEIGYIKEVKVRLNI